MGQQELDLRDEFFPSCGVGFETRSSQAGPPGVRAAQLTLHSCLGSAWAEDRKCLHSTPSGAGREPVSAVLSTHVVVICHRLRDVWMHKDRAKSEMLFSNCGPWIDDTHRRLWMGRWHTETGRRLRNFHSRRPCQQRSLSVGWAPVTVYSIKIWETKVSSFITYF